MSDAALPRRPAHARSDSLERATIVTHHAKASLATALAHAFLAGEASFPGLLARGETTLGRPYRWLRATARRYLRTFTSELRPRHREVLAFILHDKSFRFACAKYANELLVHDWLIGPQPMQHAAWVESAELPLLHSLAMLASWLHLDPAELEWFADLKGIAARSHEQRLRHYHHLIRSKNFGSIRLIEAPKVRLKHLQRQILSGILEKLPPHPSAHGFLKQRSIRSFVTPHIGQRVVLRMDLRHYFPSIQRPRVQALFRTIGFPEPVADMLGGICTTRTPPALWAALGLDHGIEIDRSQLGEAQALYRWPHLPQGAPTSPAIANLCCWRLDCRLSALAEAAGATYTRYADDLAFSGDDAFARQLTRLVPRIAAIASEEGFRTHHRKTRIMRQSARQHLAGLTVNQRMNVSRRDFDHLKAVLTNCAHFGPDGQNRDGHAEFRLHLEGRISYVESIHSQRGQRLRTIFNRIAWPS